MKGHNPIFKGELPDGSAARWQLIRSFYDQWSRPEDAPFKETLEDEELANLLKEYGVQSHSILHWFVFSTQCLGTDAPHFRDGPVFESIESFLDHPEATNAMVILESGEGDFFWGVALSDLNKDDPPVRVYSEFGIEDHVFLGSIDSLSEFALIYMAAYNPYAESNRGECIGASGTEAEIEQACEWFDFRLDISKGPMFDGVSILESKTAAAFATKETIYVSLFCAAEDLKLPAFLRSQLKAR